MATTSVYLRVSDFVREAADQRGMTQSALADAIGLTREQFNARICNRTRWALDEVVALAQLLDLDAHVVLDVACDGDEVTSA